MSTTPPRGIRLNNPGNIRRSSTVWVGQATTQNDAEYVTFVSPQSGIRAIVKILQSYKRLGLNTVAQAISRWAPPSENDTASYISDVCARCGVESDDIVDFDTIMNTMVRAIIHHENGTMPYSDAQIAQGISLA